MKKLLIPATLLLLVGVSAYAAARSAPPVASCPPSPSCPFTGDACRSHADACPTTLDLGVLAGGECAEKAAACPMTEKQCEEVMPEPDCCKRRCCPKEKAEEPKPQNP